MKVGFVGLGRMGGALARRLMRQTAINELGPETDLNDLVRVGERQARVDIVPA